LLLYPGWVLRHDTEDAPRDPGVSGYTPIRRGRDSRTAPTRISVPFRLNAGGAAP